MRQSAKRVGNAYENRACQMVQDGGLAIIMRNYNVPRLGEIDIIAEECKTNRLGRLVKTLVFIEVRVRRHGQYHQFASAIESITPAKQSKIIAAANHFLQNHVEFIKHDCRFDVIAFDEYGKNGQNSMSYWLKAAFLVE